MSLLKFTPHLLNISKYHLQRLQLQIRNIHLNYHLCKPLSNDRLLPQIDHDKYGTVHTIYKFPHMTKLQLFFSAKYFIPLVYVPLWVAEGMAYAVDEFGFGDIIFANIFQVFFLAKCLLLNKWLSHFIGFIYVTEDDNLVIAYVNFRGRRIDEKFAKGELILESNNIKMIDKLYVNLRCAATGRRFKLNLKFAEMNEEILIEYFDSLPQSAF